MHRPCSDRIGHRAPVNNFKPAALMFHEAGAALHPIPIVAVQDALDVTHFGPVDVTTDNPVVAPALCFASDGMLEAHNLVHGMLDLSSKKPWQ